MEDRLRTAMARVREPLDFIDRPIAFVLFVMIVVAVVGQIWTVVKDRRERQKAQAHG
jgi:putative tricarboxylic transport membrane protein